MKYVFRDDNGIPAPMPEGTEVDEVRTFDLVGAVERFTLREDTLRLAWEARLGDMTALLRQQMSANDAAEQTNQSWRNDPGKVLLRGQGKLSLLNDDQLAVFLTKCAGFGLDAWTGQAYPELKHSPATKLPEVVMFASIDGLWSMAGKFGECGGNDDVEFEYGDDRVPLSAKARVKKIVSGVERIFKATVFMEEYRPTKGKSEFWDSMPHLMLQKVAEAAALRKAFPNTIGKVYTPEESYKEVGRPGRGSTPPPAGSSTAEDEGPDELTNMQCHLELQDEPLRMKDHGARSALITRMSQAWPGMLEREETRFYAKVVREAKKDPKRWGVGAG